jgi:enoyl-CoA hydratase/carnithine racemase
LSDGHIHYASSEGIATITIERPSKRNALTAGMCSALAQCWIRLRDGNDRVGVIAASGDVFCAGADLNAPPGDFWRAIPDVGVDIGKPVIAAVQGPVVGLAVTLLAFCDLCVAAEDTRFIYPEAKVGVSKGLVTAWGARMPHKIAMELMLLGGPITAQRAYDTGMVNRVVPAGQQLKEAQAMARVLAGSAPRVLRQLKKLTRQTLPRSPVETQYLSAAEADYVFESDDAHEGLAAFKEKRAPRFTGR